MKKENTMTIAETGEDLAEQFRQVMSDLKAPANAAPITCLDDAAMDLSVALDMLEAADQLAMADAACDDDAKLHLVHTVLSHGLRQARAAYLGILEHI